MIPIQIILQIPIEIKDISPHSHSNHNRFNSRFISRSNSKCRHSHYNERRYDDYHHHRHHRDYSDRKNDYRNREEEYMRREILGIII